MKRVAFAGSNRHPGHVDDMAQPCVDGALLGIVRNLWSPNARARRGRGHRSFGAVDARTGETTTKAIESIDVGDSVWAWSEREGKVVRRTVNTLFRHRQRRVVEVVCATPRGPADRIRCTPEHPFWIEGMGWVPAGSLSALDRLKPMDGGSTTWVVRVSDLEGAEDVFNFEVKGDHNYFVGRRGCLVHNQSSLDGGDGPPTGVGGRPDLEPISMVETMDQVNRMAINGSARRWVSRSLFAGAVLNVLVGFVGKGLSKYHEVERANAVMNDAAPPAPLADRLYPDEWGAVTDMRLQAPAPVEVGYGLRFKSFDQLYQENQARSPELREEMDQAYAANPGKFFKSYPDYLTESRNPYAPVLDGSRLRLFSMRELAERSAARERLAWEERHALHGQIEQMGAEPLSLALRDSTSQEVLKRVGIGEGDHGLFSNWQGITPHDELVVRAKVQLMLERGDSTGAQDLAYRGGVDLPEYSAMAADHFRLSRSPMKEALAAVWTDSEFQDTMVRDLGGRTMAASGYASETVVARMEIGALYWGTRAIHENWALWRNGQGDWGSTTYAEPWAKAASAMAHIGVQNMASKHADVFLPTGTAGSLWSNPLVRHYGAAAGDMALSMAGDESINLFAHRFIDPRVRPFSSGVGLTFGENALAYGLAYSLFHPSVRSSIGVPMNPVFNSFGRALGVDAAYRLDDWGSNQP